LIAPTVQQNDVNLIHHTIQDSFFEFEQIVQMSAEVLSDLTNYTSFILRPEIFYTKLTQIQIVTLSPQTAVDILITITGHVEHQSFSVPEVINPADLEKMVNI